MIELARHSKYRKIKPKEYEEWAAKVLYGEPYSYPKDLNKLTKLIHKNLTIDLCPPRFREGNMGNPTFGHCYHSTQALYYFFKDANLKVMSAPCDVAGSHWWCEDVDGNMMKMIMVMMITRCKNSLPKSDEKEGQQNDLMMMMMVTMLMKILQIQKQSTKT